MTRLTFGFVLPMIAGALAGCATVTSKPIGAADDLRAASDAPWCDEVASGATCEARPDTKTKPAGDGISYFLPRQLLQVSATRTGGKLDDAVKALVKAQGDVEDADAAVTAISAAIRVTEDSIIAGAGGDAAKAILAARLADQNAELETDKKTLESKNAALDSAKADVKAAAAAAGQGDQANAGPGAYKVALDIKLLAPTADPQRGYLLNPRHTILRDDEHKLSVSTAGLLKTSNIVATDHTADILVEIAGFAGAIKGHALSAAGTRRGTDQPKDCKNSPSDFTGVVDPVNTAEMAQLNYDLQCIGVRLRVEGKAWSAQTGPAPQPGSGYPASIEGIVYRRPVEVRVRIEKCVDTQGACDAETGWHPTQILALALPQAGPISYVREDSGLLTKTTYDLAFDNGVLTDHSDNRPSEALELARTPMRIVQSGFDGISKVISLRTGVNNDRAALVNSSAALLNAQVAYRAAGITGDKTILDAELAKLQSQVALQVAATDGKTKLSLADQALLQQQIALQIATIKGQQDLSVAETALLNQKIAAIMAPITGQQNLANAAAGALQAQTALTLAQNSSTAQLSASDLALTASLLRDQARRDAMNRCITEKLNASEPIDACLTGY